MKDLRSEWTQIRAEAPGIAEFFTWKPVSVLTEPDSAQPAKADRASAPILKTTRHTEELPSVYASAGEQTQAEQTKQAELSAAETYGYTVVPRFASNNLTEVRAALDMCGIEPDLVFRRNPAPENHVYAIEFAGLSDASAYYINSSVCVTLYVSTEKPVWPEAAEDGSNVVYLTYDDGPTSTETLRLLDILDTYGVKATFFVTGESVEKHPASARAIVERGHRIGCHSVTHIYDQIYASVDALEQELLAWEDIVTSAGVSLDGTQRLFRYPGGSNNSAIDEVQSSAMTEMLFSHGYRIYDWNIVTNDAVLYTAPDGVSTYDYIRSTFTETFAAKVRTGGTPMILLMHETVPETIDLMPWLLETLLASGYTFGTLDTIDSWMFGMD